MSETATGTAGATTATEQATTAQSGNQSTQEFTPIGSQADLDRIVESRLARERAKYAGFDDYKTKAEQFDQLQAANQTDLEKATARAEKAEKDLASARAAQLRTEVAHAKNIPAELAVMLAGSTKDELEASADALVKHLAPKALGPSSELGKPRDNGQSGDWLRNAFQAR